MYTRSVATVPLLRIAHARGVNETLSLCRLLRVARVRGAVTLHKRESLFKRGPTFVRRRRRWSTFYGLIITSPSRSESSGRWTWISSSGAAGVKGVKAR